MSSVDGCCRLECLAAGVEPKVFPHIAGQVKISRPDRLLSGEEEQLVDPASMGVGGGGGGGGGGRHHPYQRPALADKAAAEAEADAPSQRTSSKPSEEPAAGSKPMRWCARTRRYV